MEALQIANSLPMWIACGVAVVLVIVQALIFIKKAIDAAPQVGVTKEQVNKAIKSSALTSIGPSIVVLSGMLSLLVTVGGPMGWMRLSFIGSVMFESIAAGIGTGSVGVQLGVDELTPLALTMAVWTMIIGSVGWIIFSTFAADKMDKIQAKLAGSNPAGLTIISSGAIIGVFAAMCGQKLVMVDKTALATVLGGVCMFAMMTLTKNEKFAKLREWNLTIAMPEQPVLDYDDLGILAWVDIPDEELKKLLDDFHTLMRAEKNRELLHTLKVYLESNMNYSVTAEKLYVNINTIRRRIEKVNELVEIDWENYYTRTKIGLMLQFMQF